MGPIFTLTKNIFSLFSARLIDILCRFGVLAIVTRYLGVEAYGEYVFANTFVAFFVILANMGVEEILTREIATSPGDAGRLLYGAMTIRLLLIPLATLPYLAIAFSITVSRIVIHAICIALFAQIFLSLINLFFSVFRGMEKMEYEPVVGLLINLTLISAVLAIVRLDLGFIALFDANLLAYLGAAVVLFFFVQKRLKNDSLKFDMKLGRSLIQDGYPLGISALLLAASFHVDIFVLRYLRDATEVALFQLPYQIIFRLFIIPVSLVSALFPSLSRLAGVRGDGEEGLKTTVLQNYKMLLMISTLTALLLVNLADNLVLIMGGVHFSGGVISLRILACSVIFLFVDFLQSLTLVALNKQRLLIIQNIISLAVNLMLDFALIPYYGYVGACVATLTAFAVRFAVGLIFVHRSLGGISIYPMLLKIAASGSAAGGFMLLMSGLHEVVTSLGGILIFLFVIVKTRCLSLNELNVFRQRLKT